MFCFVPEGFFLTLFVSLRMKTSPAKHSVITLPDKSTTQSMSHISEKDIFWTRVSYDGFYFILPINMYQRGQERILKQIQTFFLLILPLPSHTLLVVKQTTRYCSFHKVLDSDGPPKKIIMQIKSYDS